MEPNDLDESLSLKDLLGILACILFLVIVAVALAALFILLIQGILSVVGWMIWEI